MFHLPDCNLKPVKSEANFKNTSQYLLSTIGRFELVDEITVTSKIRHTCSRFVIGFSPTVTTAKINRPETVSEFGRVSVTIMTDELHCNWSRIEMQCVLSFCAEWHFKVNRDMQLATLHIWLLP